MMPEVRSVSGNVTPVDSPESPPDTPTLTQMPPILKKKSLRFSVMSTEAASMACLPPDGRGGEEEEPVVTEEEVFGEPTPLENAYSQQDEQERNRSRFHSVASRTVSVSSNATIDSTASSLILNRGERWIDNTDARNSIVVSITSLYALILFIFGFIIEIAHLIHGEDRRSVQYKDFFFSIFMYGISLIFFAYCYCLLLMNPRWHLPILWLKNMFVKKHEEEVPELIRRRHRIATHDSVSAGSLFLRIGCVIFGVVGMVYHAFSLYLCSTDDLCRNANIAVEILAILFVLIQMHFIFVNWKMTVMGHHTIMRFGTMHLVATNLWLWVRYVIIEESHIDYVIQHVFAINRDETLGQNLSWVEQDASAEVIESSIEVTDFLHSTYETRLVKAASPLCHGASCILGGLTGVMYTSLVEYSLIGAGVMFVVWLKIDHVRSTPSAYVKRKHHIKVDCSNMTSGLFFGLMFVAATLTMMAVFYGFTLMRKHHSAAYVFSITSISQFGFMMAASLFGLWIMRILRFHTGGHNHIKETQELLDMILLVIGTVGELMHSVSGVLGLTGAKSWQFLSGLLLANHICRLAQVVFQTSFIYLGSKLVIHGDHELIKTQPGKQVITFLILANAAMFFMYLLETEKAGVSENVINFYGERGWVFLVRCFSPISIFYRFHSAVCLAEVWKNTYAFKH